MTGLAQLLKYYGAYHRDRRNVAYHCVGIPLIVLSVGILLSRPAIPVLGLNLTPALLGTALLCLYYLRLQRRLGLVMTVWLALSVWLADTLASLSDTVWLGGGLALFVGGWILQFIGHYHEGRKPAFMDDLRGLLVGPVFVAVEILDALGLAAAFIDVTPPPDDP